MATADQSVRRQAELQHARESLRTEWEYWTAEAARSSLQKHQTQIDSVITMLGAGLDAVAADAQAAESERILDLHHVWDFFRVKLALRYIEPIRDFLDAADELAWTAYHPATQAADGPGPVRREPPLVFLDRGAVPFASARGSSYRDLLPRDVRTRAGADAARGLPFPVIGVPWYLSGHLPGVLLVAHEVGHHIEDDCALTTALSRRLAAARLPAPRLAAWKLWLGEVFADVVASLTCGVAYPTVLLDALAAAPAGGAGLERYPPPRARIRVCLAAIGQAGLPGNEQLAAEGDQLGEPDDADGEAQPVVEAILIKPYGKLGKQTLPAVLTSPAVASADAAAGRLLAGLSSSLHDVRAVLAAAALAFARNPAEYDQRRVGERSIAEVLRLRPDGPRLGVADPAARKARDVAAGRALASRLRG